jgi:hypothetical protein
MDGRENDISDLLNYFFNLERKIEEWRKNGLI